MIETEVLVLFVLFEEMVDVERDGVEVGDGAVGE